jgi:membrane fusion protein (multidrug efflux system)
MFARTFRSIETESEGRSPFVPTLIVLLVGAWMSWFVLVSVDVYETSTHARLEVARAIHPIESSVAGRVLAVHDLRLGRSVRDGEVLVELDAEQQRLELAEVLANEDSLGPQIGATRRELDAEQDSLEAEEKKGKFAGQEGASRNREAVVMAELAKTEAARLERLYVAGLVAEADLDRGKGEVARKQALLMATAAGSRRTSSEALGLVSDRRIRIASLERELAKLEGDLTITRTRAASLRHDIERRTIRAVGDGKLGEVGTILVGATLKSGDRIASVLAEDELRIVAEFPPASVFGRVHEGQSARVQFDGFPWAEYGAATATVRNVASEVRDGQARVELALNPASHHTVPLQHGLTASVSIAIERTTPATLALRLIGKARRPIATESASR